MASGLRFNVPISALRSESRFSSPRAVIPTDRFVVRIRFVVCCVCAARKDIIGALSLLSEFLARSSWPTDRFLSALANRVSSGHECRRVTKFIYPKFVWSLKSRH
jgi:hypothetical protein